MGEGLLSGYAMSGAKKRSVFNFILSNYILASVLITTTNHTTTRYSYRYPRARCLFSLQVPSSGKKRHLRHFRDLNVLFSQNRGCLRYTVCGTDVTYTFWYPHTTCGLSADSMAFTIHTNLAEAMPRLSPFWRGILQVPSYALPLWIRVRLGKRVEAWIQASMPTTAKTSDTSSAYTDYDRYKVINLETEEPWVQLTYVGYIYDRKQNETMYHHTYLTTNSHIQTNLSQLIKWTHDILHYHNHFMFFDLSF